jgi:hypothetical protein
MTKTAEKKPVKRPAGLMDLHLRLVDPSGKGIDAQALWEFADAVVRACAAPAPEMRRRIFLAVEALRDA